MDRSEGERREGGVPVAGCIFGLPQTTAVSATSSGRDAGNRAPGFTSSARGGSARRRFLDCCIVGSVPSPKQRRANVPADSTIPATRSQKLRVGDALPPKNGEERHPSLDTQLQR
eukprot:GHVU01075531.1.p1 GENE.GHVU01075531.1~~GHVU01075531.1.p1  ORF type:complete len:115 (+),score=5.47 GHVU01075531.1:38-382(+)